MFEKAIASCNPLMLVLNLLLHDVVGRGRGGVILNVTRFFHYASVVKHYDKLDESN